MSVQNIPKPAAAWLGVLGLIILAMGLFFAWYGWELVSLKGSPYFLIAGCGLILSAVQIVGQRLSGALLYFVVLAGTLIWALADVGIDFWPLVSRLLTLTGIAILVALSLPLLPGRQKAVLERDGRHHRRSGGGLRRYRCGHVSSPRSGERIGRDAAADESETR